MFKKYFIDQSGNFSVIAGLTALPVIMAIGFATDASFVIKKRQTLQEVIDGAALSAIYETNHSRAKVTFTESLNAKGYSTEDNIRIKSFNRKEINGHVTIQANVSGTHKVMFGSILGRPETDYAASTSVVGQKRISSIRFIPTFGSGYLNKVFGLWVNRPNTAIPEMLATFTWTSSAPITFPNGSSPGRLDSSQGGAVDLGDYTDFFMTTTITDPWTTYTREQMVEVYGEDFTIFSNEPGHGDHFFVNGKQLEAEDMVDFTRDFSCDQSALNFDWEDAPGFAQPSTDFRFTVMATCDDIDSGTIRIND
jgi:Flp pilus assembly protein TadG